jgi:hypothetical protein
VIDSPAAPEATVLAPGNLWQHLGERPHHPFTPFAAQLDVFSKVHIPWPGEGHPRVYTLRCGRRFSKTTTLEKLLWQGMLAPDDFFGPPTVRVTADTEEHAHKVWDRFIRHLTTTPLKALLDEYKRDRELVTFINGANAQLLSSNNPNALAGDGVTLWIVDEAQYWTQEAFDNAFPSMSERNGVMVMAGVCEGSGPFRSASFWGMPGQDHEFRDLSYPTSANPFVPKAFIEFARRKLSPNRFKQLYLAQWVGELGKVFRGVEACVNKKKWIEHPLGFCYTADPGLVNRNYYGGLDLGRLQDWSVYTLWRPDGELVAWDRYAVVDWEVQKARMVEMSKLYGHPPTMVDSTGIGDPIVDDLTRLGMNVEGYQISSNAKKRVLVDELAIRIGSLSLSYPEIREFIDELNNFEATRGKDGSEVVKYSAPSGMHDDFVLSAALACQKLPQSSRVQATDEVVAERQKGIWEEM